jgi:two-component system chemotaxis response regulator CheY
MKGTVVIVDDSERTRSELRVYLEELNFLVVAEAADGIQAIDAYVRNKPDILTLDLVMPHLDGMSALSEIHKYHPEAKVIIISSSINQTIRSEAEKLGVESFIQKPVTFEKISLALNNLSSLRKGKKYG